MGLELKFINYEFSAYSSSLFLMFLHSWLNNMI